LPNFLLLLLRLIFLNQSQIFKKKGSHALPGSLFSLSFSLSPFFDNGCQRRAKMATLRLLRHHPRRGKELYRFQSLCTYICSACIVPTFAAPARCTSPPCNLDARIRIFVHSHVTQMDRESDVSMMTGLFCVLLSLHTFSLSHSLSLVLLRFLSHRNRRLHDCLCEQGIHSYSRTTRHQHQSV